MIAGLQLLVLAKAPVSGRVKTRLCPPFLPNEAAELAAAALADVLDAVRAAPAARRVLVLDGDPDLVDTRGFHVVPQVVGALDVRLAAAFAAALTQEIIERHVDDVVLVADDEIVAALRLILERTKLLVEPAGAAAVAALLTGKAGLAKGTRAVATLSGGNVDREKLKRLL